MYPLFDLCVQSLLVGGLFPQFSSRRDDMGTTVIDEAGIRRLAAVLMAIRSINNNTSVLPQTKVRCKSTVWYAVCCNMILIVGHCFASL